MKWSSDPAILGEVRAIAAAAGEAIMGVYGSEFSVEFKDDKSPLTEADRRAHNVIVAGLSALEPALPILSEESATEDLEGRRGWDSYWLVDPLDGTKEFVKRNGEFTVNIALIEQHRAVMGVVLAPATKLEYFGAVELGASKRIADGPEEAISAILRQEGPVRVVCSRSHPSGALATYLESLGEHELKPMGSSLKICLVADGQADIYPRLGPTSEWDTAAAQAILESSGGSMMDTLGQELRYNMKESLLNPYFLAFGDSDRDWLTAVSSH
ncbi:MAG: 3'(2'),5'-bisphosphate nucleotidase CysQ [Candidatus Rariloculaceae bacterium]